MLPFAEKATLPSITRLRGIHQAATLSAMSLVSGGQDECNRLERSVLLGPPPPQRLDTSWTWTPASARSAQARNDRSRRQRPLP